MESTFFPQTPESAGFLYLAFHSLLKYLLSCHKVVLFTGFLNEGMHAIPNQEPRSDVCRVLHTYSIMSGVERSYTS